MTRQLSIELPDDLAASAESEAGRSARPVDAVVADALVEYLGWQAVAATRVAGADLDEASAEQMVYAELDRLRAERAGA